MSIQPGPQPVPIFHSSTRDLDAILDVRHDHDADFYLCSPSPQQKPKGRVLAGESRQMGGGSFLFVKLLIQKSLHLLESITHKSHLLYSVKCEAIC